MNPIQLQLTIPPVILALKDVNPSEKMLLALYTDDPGAKDIQALKVLSVGLSGLKKIKKRLNAKGLLERTARGHKVLLPGEGHLVTKINILQKVEKVAPQRTALVVMDDMQDLFDSFYAAANSPATNVRTLPIWALQLTDLIEEARPLLGDECAAILAEAEFRRNRWTVHAYAFNAAKTPPEYFQVAPLINRATAAQLSTIYERISSDHQLGPGNAPLLLEAELLPA